MLQAFDPGAHWAAFLSGSFWICRKVPWLLTELCPWRLQGSSPYFLAGTPFLEVPAGPCLVAAPTGWPAKEAPVFRPSRMGLIACGHWNDPATFVFSTQRDGCHRFKPFTLSAFCAFICKMRACSWVISDFLFLAVQVST